MKILVSWLRDLVDVPVAPEKLAADLHMAGFEVASVEPPPGAADAAADAVIDLEITANRPDCLGVLGIAREVSTLYRTALRVPALADLGGSDPARAGGLRVTIDDTRRCGRYCGALAEARIAPSPAWMQQRLAACGIRPINNVVDVTNYVLLEIGHPMHAFDFDRLAGGEIRVRGARTGERLRTLDGQDRTLEDGVLVIADEAHPTAIAGVMGGAGSEVSTATRTIAFESAWFDPATVRRASKRLALSTEASYRFERGADIDAAPVALARACALLQQIGAGTPCGGWIDAYPSRHVPRQLRLDARRVARVLGVEVAGEEIARILTGLGFTIAGGGGTFDVRVPSWRVDVVRDVDLIEEVARHYGYDRLPTTFPALAGVPARPNRRLERDRLARRVAGAAGFDECVTFSFIPRDRAAGFADPSQTVEILNPLSEQFAVLRPSLLSGLVDAVAHNRRRGVEDVRVFELGTVFTAAGGERRALGFAWTGAAVPPHWSGPSRAVDFFDMKGVVEQVGRALGAPILCAPASTAWLVRGRAASLHLAASPDGSAVGALGLLHPSRVAPLDLPASTEIYVAELDLEAIVPSMTFDGVPRVQSPPKHPSIVRDISIVVDDTLPAADVRGTIRAAAPPTLAQVREFDRYQGAGVPDGRVSLSYRLTFQGADRTLTDAEVQRAMDGILEALSRTHRAVQR